MLWRSSTGLCYLLPKVGDEDVQFILNWFFSDCYEVQMPEFNFPEIQGVHLQDFYLSLSLAWLQGKAQ